MFKNMILHFWSLRKEFARYFIVGVGAVVVDVGSLYLMKEHLHLSATLAIIINQPIIVTSIFFINKNWAFKAGGVTHQQMIKFYILALLNYFFSVVWIFIFHDKLGFYYLWVRLINIILAVSWNFLLYKYWVYRTHDTRDTQNDTKELV